MNSAAVFDAPDARMTTGTPIDQHRPRAGSSHRDEGASRGGAWKFSGLAPYFIEP